MSEADPQRSEPVGYIEDKKRYSARLKRIEGQVRGIERMVDQEEYCIDILTQISAVNSALKKVAVGLLDDHLRHCVHRAIDSDEEQRAAQTDQKLREASEAIARLLKS